jgi:hypothetical protein
MKKLSYKLMIWDWKESPDIKDVQNAIKKGYINFYEIDTGGDEYCWVASKTKLTKAELHSIEKKEFYDEDEDDVVIVNKIVPIKGTVGLDFYS